MTTEVPGIASLGKKTSYPVSERLRRERESAKEYYNRFIGPEDKVTSDVTSPTSDAQVVVYNDDAVRHGETVLSPNVATETKTDTDDSVQVVAESPEIPARVDESLVTNPSHQAVAEPPETPAHVDESPVTNPSQDGYTDGMELDDLVHEYATRDLCMEINNDDKYTLRNLCLRTSFGNSQHGSTSGTDRYFKIRLDYRTILKRSGTPGMPSVLVFESPGMVENFTLTTPRLVGSIDISVDTELFVKTPILPFFTVTAFIWRKNKYGEDCATNIGSCIVQISRDTANSLDKDLVFVKNESLPLLYQYTNGINNDIKTGDMYFDMAYTAYAVDGKHGLGSTASPIVTMAKYLEVLSKKHTEEANRINCDGKDHMSTHSQSIEEEEEEHRERFRLLSKIRKSGNKCFKRDTFRLFGVDIPLLVFWSSTCSPFESSYKITRANNSETDESLEKLLLFATELGNYSESGTQPYNSSDTGLIHDFFNLYAHRYLFMNDVIDGSDGYLYESDEPSVKISYTRSGDCEDIVRCLISLHEYLCRRESTSQLRRLDQFCDILKKYIPSALYTSLVGKKDSLHVVFCLVDTSTCTVMSISKSSKRAHSQTEALPIMGNCIFVEATSLVSGNTDLHVYKTDHYSSFTTKTRKSSLIYTNGTVYDKAYQLYLVSENIVINGGYYLTSGDEFGISMRSICSSGECCLVPAILPDRYAPYFLHSLRMTAESDKIEKKYVENLLGISMYSSLLAKMLFSEKDTYTSYKTLRYTVTGDRGLDTLEEVKMNIVGLANRRIKERKYLRDMEPRNQYFFTVRSGTCADVEKRAENFLKKQNVLRYSYVMLSQDCCLFGIQTYKV